MELRPDAYVWRQVADELISRIKAGQYQPGMPIPAERRLAEELGVAVGSARRAVGVLRDEGWVTVLPQKGVYVRPVEDWPTD
ncbi:DNA-binding FadR family transcriptional regulator [Nonomuraea muscovyensis]|uniref:DNA-binding FadR family transcriptional regulator n=1 Tax=Nonomuraea muscovyensis TaxID=1124761 RepID=A0A7X0BXV4_9ACTN|nr:winged helix-turn-helix domain-containing protein [Nonomuraea muscovyensis]MBB6343770.1 DNA-binding FadR family transcriptional regulator [Nonomuraea muscovyensis]